MAGVFGAAFAASLIAPNALVALEKPLNKLVSRDRRERKRIAKYMVQEKLLSVTENSDGTYTVLVTIKGMRRATRARLDRIEIEKRQWDKQWRLVMFDIPEKHKTGRDFLAGNLKRVGFLAIQRSVFIYPFPIDSFMAVFFDVVPELRPYVSYMTVSEITHHNLYVKKFAAILP